MIDDSKIWGMVDDVFEANDYAHNISEVSDSDWESPLWDEEQMKDAIEKGIRCGIQEFIKSLWHDAAEEPEEGKKCIGHYKCTSLDAITFELPIAYNTWNEYVRYSTLKKWCYADDIMPREGGKK